MPRTIIQASDLKTKLETLNISPANTIISLDAKDFYPSVHFNLVRKAVQYFSKDLEQNEKETIAICLDMIQFGMKSTYIMFQDQYYEYDGDQDPEDRGLTIGGFESAWLADLAGAYLLIKSRTCFDETLYHGIYRDDGIVVFKGKKIYDDILTWHDNFQAKVNQLTGGDYLQFTCEIWADPKHQPLPQPPTSTTSHLIEINTTQAFPYLDMEFYWYNKALAFKVHLKPNQCLKYLNVGSCHSKSVFRAIPCGVCHRLAKLTTTTPANKNVSLQELYPHHFKALNHSNLLHTKSMPTVPTLHDAKAKYKPVPKSKRTQQQKDHDARRTAYFVIGQCSAWTTPIWVIIKRLKTKYDLGWLRSSMAYHRYSNLREIFNGDLTYKLNKEIISDDFKKLPCNCKDRATIGCNYNNHCRDSIVVYRVQCKASGKSYIGCTQQKLKKWMEKHYTEVRNLRHKGIASDTFAKHFDAMSINFPDPSPTLLRNMSTIHIEWDGLPLSAVKTFGTNNCLLCNQERLQIFKWFKTKPHLLINSCNEIYGACKHRPKFHRFIPALSSTDESSMDEKVKVTTEIKRTRMLVSV